MEDPRLVAFDLDGVLYSSEGFLGEAYREAIANVNRRRPGSFERVPTTREILDHVGWPVPIILQRLFPAAGDAALGLLHDETLAVICRHVAARDGVLFPGVASTLSTLRKAGYVLAVASNGRRRYIETVLATYDIEQNFVELISADEVGDKTALLRAYLKRLPACAEHTVMVGDRASDVEAAAANGCRFVGCDYGHGYRDEIADAGPVVSKFDELPEVIGEFLDR